MFVSVEVVYHTSLRRFQEDDNAPAVFKMTVAGQVQGLEAENVHITDVTDFADNSVVSPIMLESRTKADLARTLEDPAPGTAVNEDKVLVLYRLVFIAQRVVVANSDVAEAYNLTATQLREAVRKGLFSSTLRELAAVHDAPAFLSATTELLTLFIDSQFSTIVTHSAIPTSQPSSVPSSQPSSRPTAQPSVQPSSEPTSQPTVQPSGRPTAAPTLTIETKWRNTLEGIFTHTVTQYQPLRATYFALDVSGVNLYGSCESWNRITQRTLLTTEVARAVHTLELVTVAERPDSPPVVYRCAEPDKVQEIVRALVAHDGKHSTAVRVLCGGEADWVIQDCGAAAHTAPSKGLCINCEDPCRQYDCTSSVGSTVLSLCSREPTCSYLKGSLQVLTAYSTSREGAGVVPVVVSYGTIWAAVLIAVLGYDLMIRWDKDWSDLRRAPKLTLLGKGRTGSHKKAAVAPATPPMPTLSSSTTASPRSSVCREVAQEICNELSAAHRISRIVHTILDRLLIAAGSNLRAVGADHLPVMQMFWYRMVSYNHYLAPYCSATQWERLLHGLNVLTRVSWLFFCVALCLWYNYPEDDDSCYFKGTAEECGQRVSPFDSSQEYCAWVGELDASEDGRGNDEQGRHQAQCVWQMHTVSVAAVVHIVVVTTITAVISKALYTSFLLEAVLLAPTAESTDGCLLFSEEGPVDHQILTRDRSAVSADSQQPRTPVSPNRSRGARRVAPVPHPEAPTPAEAAEAQWQEFIAHLSRYREGLAKHYPLQRSQFRDRWIAANPIVYSLSETHKDLRRDVLHHGSTARYAAKLRVVEELVAVQREVEEASPAFDTFSAVDEDQFSVRLMALFFADLLGKDSIQSRLVQRMLGDLLQDSAPFRDVRNWVKFCVILFFLATCLCLVYGSIVLLEGFSARRQWYWVITAAVAVAADLVVVEGVEALWFQWALPLCVADYVFALKQTLTAIFARYTSTARTPSTASGVYTVTGGGMELAHASASPNSNSFSMPHYQFVSTNLARRFPRHVASRIVLSYESVYPRTIMGQRWPIHQTSHWSSGLGVESVGYVIFSTAAMRFALRCPPLLQRMLITGAICLAIWLLHKTVRQAQGGDLTGVCAWLAVTVATILAVLSYRIPWDGDSARFEATVQPLCLETAEGSVQPQHTAGSAPDPSRLSVKLGFYADVSSSSPCTPQQSPRQSDGGSPLNGPTRNTVIGAGKSSQRAASFVAPRVRDSRHRSRRSQLVSVAEEAKDQPRGDGSLREKVNSDLYDLSSSSDGSLGEISGAENCANPGVHQPSPARPRAQEINPWSRRKK